MRQRRLFVSGVYFLSSYLGYINGLLLIDRASSTYLNVRLKALASVICSSLICF
jgi:hypothetical protein